MNAFATADELLCQSALYALDNEQLYGLANVMLTAPERFAALLQAECAARLGRGVE